MSFRTRVLTAFVLLVLLPLIGFGIGIRTIVRDRLTAQYERRVAQVLATLERDLAQETETIDDRLQAIADAFVADNRLRRALRAADARDADRAYLRDFAGRAMRASGLAMLFVLDENERIVSSGHFRNEYGRLEPGLARGLQEGDTPALLPVRTAVGQFTALARADSIRLGERRLTVVGGTDFGRGFLERWEWDENVSVTLEPLDETNEAAPGPDRSPAVGAAVRAMPVTILEADGTGQRMARAASIRAAHAVAPLHAVTRSVDRWFFLGLLTTGVVAILLAWWLWMRLSRPLAELAGKTAALDLDALDVDFAMDRADEVGVLSRGLGAMAGRLRLSAARLREAERRVAVGDMARQVNHDIKNGLAPIRNVLRHLTEVVRDRPEELPTVFRERRDTFDGGLAYLESLASKYAQLSPGLATEPCDVNAIVRRVVGNMGTVPHATIQTTLASPPPPLVARGDVLAVQRVLENVLQNAVQSFGGGGPEGTVTVSTDVRSGGLDGSVVRVIVADTGRGMDQDELERVFQDFYTTTPGGTGLGLSIVRRLVGDLGGRLRVESAPGSGTRFIIDLPAWSTPIEGAPS